MIVTRHAKFLKNYKKRIFLHSKIHSKFKERLALFIENPTHLELHDHKLTGDKKGFRAFSITGDIRVVYRWKSVGT